MLSFVRLLILTSILFVATAQAQVNVKSAGSIKFIKATLGTAPTYAGSELTAESQPVVALEASIPLYLYLPENYKSRRDIPKIPFRADVKMTGRADKALRISWGSGRGSYIIYVPVCYSPEITAGEIRFTDIAGSSLGNWRLSNLPRTVNTLAHMPLHDHVQVGSVIIHFDAIRRIGKRNGDSDAILFGAWLEGDSKVVLSNLQVSLPIAPAGEQPSPVQRLKSTRRFVSSAKVLYAADTDSLKFEFDVNLTPQSKPKHFVVRVPVRSGNLKPALANH